MQRYNEFGPWLKNLLGMKVQKISINAGFTCPNRDGRVGVGGCTYCNNQTFNPEYCRTEKSVAQQLEEGKRFFSRKYPEMKYMAYFQAYTNTYSGLEVLKRKYEDALGVDGVVGIVIGTRPDCVSNDLLDYLSELNRQVCVIVEYGIESVHDKTLERINRGHDYACVVDAVNRTSERGLITGGHVILGLPGESRDEILEGADVLSGLPLTTLKLHQLQLIKGTRMSEEYFADPEGFHLFSAEEYVDLVIDYVERLRPDIVLERFVSQSPSSLLAIPGWGLKNFEFVEKVRRRMEERNAYQGRLYLGSNK